ncbi:hypothetical protein MCEMRE203_00148 [Candidatus Nanopelagicaceae bacterium]
MHIKLISLVLVFSTLIGSSASANAAGQKPVLQVDCGLITGKYDEYGTYGLFSPKVTVKYYGSPLTVTSYYYETPSTKKSGTGQNIVTFTNKAPSTRFFVSQVDIQQKVLQFGQSQSGYFKFVIEAVDTLKRKASSTCLYKDYYYSSAIIPNSGSSILKGFNRSSCTFDQKPLYGKVEIVDYGQDFDVQIVDYGQDLKVEEVSYGAYSCGKWEIVDYGANFKIKLVSYGADFKIKIVEYGAGT